MSRASTTSDVFNAVAEPRRRENHSLAGRRQDSLRRRTRRSPGFGPTGGLQAPRRIAQVGLVTVEQCGKNRLYSLNPAELKPVFDWAAQLRAILVAPTRSRQAPRRTQSGRAGREKLILVS
ncbi:MAG: hypothetical protein QM811_18175 [Pirellulales bacterium]